MRIVKHILNPETDLAFCGKKQSRLYVNKPNEDLKERTMGICKKCFKKARKFYKIIGQENE